MPVEAVMATLRDVWRSLGRLNLPVAVMGGIALAAWEHVRATKDVDLLVGVETTDVEELVEQLAEDGFRAKRQPPLLPVGEMRFLQLLYTPAGTFVDLQVDLLLADSVYQQTALGRRTRTALHGVGVGVDVLSCEDLVIHKLLAGRIIDRADAASLLRANRESMDVTYLQEWTERLGLTRELREIWEEAFPGESAPAIERSTE